MLIDSIFNNPGWFGVLKRYGFSPWINSVANRPDSGLFVRCEGTNKLGFSFIVKEKFTSFRQVEMIIIYSKSKCVRYIDLNRHMRVPSARVSHVPAIHGIQFNRNGIGPSFQGQDIEIQH